MVHMDQDILKVLYTEQEIARRIRVLVLQILKHLRAHFPDAPGDLLLGVQHL